jgi:hypothetical protein
MQCVNAGNLRLWLRGMEQAWVWSRHVLFLRFISSESARIPGPVAVLWKPVRHHAPCLNRFGAEILSQWILKWTLEPNFKD